MQFSIYSELQTWPGKTQQQVYAEALEQVVNADRLGYSTFSIIEHFFFAKFGASPNPFAFFAKASERTRDHGANAADPVASGFQRVLLVPGLEYNAHPLMVYADVERPVYQHFTGNQLAASLLYKVSVSYHF